MKKLTVCMCVLLYIFFLLYLFFFEMLAGCFLRCVLISFQPIACSRVDLLLCCCSSSCCIFCLSYPLLLLHLWEIGSEGIFTSSSPHVLEGKPAEVSIDVDDACQQPCTSTEIHNLPQCGVRALPPGINVFLWIPGTRLTSLLLVFEWHCLASCISRLSYIMALDPRVCFHYSPPTIDYPDRCSLRSAFLFKALHLSWA